MEIIDKLYTSYPFYGSRKMMALLKRHRYLVNRKRVIRLMQLMRLQALYQKPNISKAIKRKII
jgi:putative transposase